MQQTRLLGPSSTMVQTQNKFLVPALICSIFVALVATSSALSVDGKPELSPTVYTSWYKNVSYASSTDYNAMGMQPLYNITKTVLWFLMGEDPLPDGYIEIKNNEFHYGPKTKNNEWGELIKKYWIILLIMIVSAILIVMMPLVGLCFCCCRCAGACGGRSEPFDKKHDTCRRVFHGFFLIVLATGLLFGVIATFATNQYMNNGITGLTSSTRTATLDTQKYISTTGEQLDYVLVNNYKELSIQLQKILDETSQFIINNLENKSSAVSMIYLTDMLDKLPEIKDKLQQMKLITNELRVHASQLSDGLRGVRHGLLEMLTKCEIAACKNVLNDYEIGKLDANGIHYDQLPDVTLIISNLDELISGNIASAGQRGREALESMRVHLRQQIAKNTPQIVQSLRSAGKELQRTSTEINNELNRISTMIGRHSEKYTGVADNILEEYNPYRFYYGLAVCCTLLVILILLVAALFCGICGKRPGGYGDDCCNKGAGARFLMIAVALIFLTFSLILATAIAHFLLGAVAYRGICVPFENPDTDPMFSKIDAVIDLNDVLYPQGSKTKPTSGVLPPLRFAQVIVSCKANNTIYEVLHLQNRIAVRDIKEYPTKHKINQTLDNLVNSIDFQESDIRILTEEDKQRILSLGESALKNFDSGQFIDNLGDNITKHSLTEIANQLRLTANQVPANAQKDVPISLRNQALHLETYEQNLVIPMKEQTNRLIKLAEELDAILRYKNRPFEDSIPMLVQEIVRAQRFINDEGRPFVRAAASNLTKYFANEIDRYLELVVDSVEHEIGRCGPMANVYNATLVSVCNRFVNPLNGFWAGCVWCALLFIPILFVAVRLSSLYQKSDPYPGHLVESEYLYDAYSERDHIPMSNGPKNKRRKNKDRRRHEYFEEAAMPPSSSSAGGSGARDTRYSDMAPKHWDGGPPRYANPPMAPPASEYERPPPYYYPGASEQD